MKKLITGALLSLLFARVQAQQGLCSLPYIQRTYTGNFGANLYKGKTYLDVLPYSKLFAYALEHKGEAKYKKVILSKDCPWEEVIVWYATARDTVVNVLDEGQDTSMRFFMCITESGEGYEGNKDTNALKNKIETTGYVHYKKELDEARKFFADYKYRNERATYHKESKKLYDYKELNRWNIYRSSVSLMLNTGRTGSGEPGVSMYVVGNNEGSYIAYYCNGILMLIEGLKKNKMIVYGL